MLTFGLVKGVLSSMAKNVYVLNIMTQCWLGPVVTADEC